MGPDLPPIPPVAAPQAAIVVPVRQEAEPIAVDSHGFHYVVTGNFQLPPEAVIASLQAGENPKAAIEALNQAYQKAGYFLVALRGQVDRQLVAIQVIRGRITEQDIVPSLVPFYEGLEGREDLERNTLIRKSALAEAYAARQGLRPKVNFGPATEPGGSKITVTEEPVPDAKPWNAGLGFGNLGSRFSSRYLASANGVVRPGAGLELTANYSQGLPGLSDDSQGSLYHSASFGISAVTPWGLYSGSYNGTRYRIGQSAAPFYPDGEIAVWGATGTQLAYADEAGRLTLNESFTRTSNVVTVLDGATTITDQHYDFVSAGASFNRAFAAFGANASFAAGVTVSKGLSAPAGSFLLAGGADTRFALVQGSVNYTQALPMGYAAGLNWSGQWADATVPQNQQWVLGGFGNLTAWLPAVLVGDIGTLARASLSTPAWTWSGLSLTGGAFVEGGTAQRHITPIDTPVSRGLADAGLSVSGNLKGGTSLLVAYAWPIASRNLGQDALDRLDRAHLYFSLNQSF